jgi:hypothetical protein
MGMMDKFKSAMQVVTGGSAKVVFEFSPASAMPGDMLHVKVTATSTGSEVKSKGAFVDLFGSEAVMIKAGTMTEQKTDIRVSQTTLDQAFQISSEFVLAPNETKVFEGTIQIPLTLQPSFGGFFAQHQWQIRGRIEAFGNDPDSGYKPIKIGVR